MHALVQLAYIMNGILCVNELIIHVVLQAIMHESNVGFCFVTCSYNFAWFLALANEGEIIPSQC